MTTTNPEVRRELARLEHRINEVQARSDRRIDDVIVWAGSGVIIALLIILYVSIILLALQR